MKMSASKSRVYNSSNHCLICYTSGESLSEGPTATLYFSGEEKRHFQAFILNVLFEIPKVEIDSSLWEEEDGNEDNEHGCVETKGGNCVEPRFLSPSCGIKVCISCEKQVNRARKLYNELLEISRKFRSIQKDIVIKLKRSSEEEDGGEREKRNGDNQIQTRGYRNARLDKAYTVVMEKSRNFVCQRDYGDFLHPLIIDVANNGWSSLPVPNNSSTVGDQMKQEIDTIFPDDMDGMEMFAENFCELSESGSDTPLPQPPLACSDGNPDKISHISVDSFSTSKSFCDFSQEEKKAMEDELNNVESASNDEEENGSEWKHKSDYLEEEDGDISKAETDESEDEQEDEVDLNESELSATDDIKLEITHKCHKCSKAFGSGLGLLRHLRVIHKVRVPKAKGKMHALKENKKKMHKCKFCDKAYSYEKGLIRHLKITHQTTEDTSKVRKRKFDKYYHPDTKNYHCPYCPARLLKTSNFQEHITRHRSNTGFKCRFCDKQFNNAHNRNRHETVHAYGPKRPTKQQLLDMEREQELEVKRQKKEEEQKKREENQCPICQKTSINRAGIRKHISRYHKGQHIPKLFESDKFPCPEPGCGKFCTTQQNLEIHISRHRGDPQFPCQFCQEKFYVYSALKRHREKFHSEGGPKSFVCEICGHSTSCNDYLNSHRHLVHGIARQRYTHHRKEMVEKIRKKTNGKSQGDTLFQCEICGKNLSTSNTLKIHMMNAHKGDSRHSCSACGKGFLTPSMLKRHMFEMHKLGDPVEISNYFNKIQKCSVVGCKRRYYGKESLEEHMKKEHGENGDRKPYQCTTCGKGFCFSNKLRTHELGHINKDSKPYKCKICDKGFPVPRYLQQHELIVHKIRKRPMKKGKGIKTEIGVANSEVWE